MVSTEQRVGTDSDDVLMVLTGIFWFSFWYFSYEMEPLCRGIAGSLTREALSGSGIGWLGLWCSSSHLVLQKSLTLPWTLSSPSLGLGSDQLNLDMAATAVLVKRSGNLIFFLPLSVFSGDVDPSAPLQLLLVPVGGERCVESFTHMSQGLSHTSILLIVVGIIVSLLVFLGSIGAWSDSRLLLGLFTGFRMLILSLQIVSGILFYVFRNKVERRITLKAKEVIMKHSPRDKVAIDDLQDAFHCCGAGNYTDWLLQSSHGNISVLPHSCCHVDSVACVKVVTTDNIYQRVSINQHREGRGGYQGHRSG
ncbi:unnamed protein product [Coregonus sp. 'balchen']|nr:unnamed protein product [Coregonus sp. 'balchen']